MSDSSTAAEQWFYNLKSKKQGPASTFEMQSLLAQNILQPDTYVWQMGMAAWLPLKDTKLFQVSADTPPLLTGKLVSNKWMWLFIIVPSIYEMGLAGAVKASATGPVPYFALLAFIYLWLNTLFLALDYRYLRRIGYPHNTWMIVCAYIMYPGYMLIMASLVKQKFASYLVAWVVIFAHMIWNGG